MKLTMRSVSFRPFALSVVLALSSAVGCVAEPQVDIDNDQAAAGVGTTVANGLRSLITRFRYADIPTTGGFGRSLANHLDEVVRGAGDDVAAQRSALKSLFGAELPDDVAPSEFVASFKRAFDLQFEPVLKNAANAGGAANNLAHVDSIVADVIETLPDIVKNLRQAGIPEERAMDLLLAVAWHDVGKVMDPAFIESVPRVKELLASETFLKALAKVPVERQEGFKKGFILQVLCHEFGSIEALDNDKNLKETVAKRLISFIEDHNDGSGYGGAWWNTQWRNFFGVEYATPRTATGFLLAALDRARQGAIELAVDAGTGAKKLDGGIIKIAYQEKSAGKKLGFVISSAIITNNANSLAQLKGMAGTTRFGELLVTKFQFFKQATERHAITQSMLKAFVAQADEAAETVVVNVGGKAVVVNDLDTFFRLLQENWDELYAVARLGS